MDMLRKTDGQKSGKPEETEDQLNREIIRVLEDDGRTPYSEIAQALGVSEGTVRNRISRLKASGALRIVAVVDPSATEYHTSAMLKSGDSARLRSGGCGRAIGRSFVRGLYSLGRRPLRSDCRSRGR